jgi:hypothetical protein
VTEISRIQKRFEAQERKEPPKMGCPGSYQQADKKKILCCRKLATMPALFRWLTQDAL